MLAKAPLNFPECLQLSGKSSQNPHLFDPFCPISIGYGHGRSYLNRRKTNFPKMRVLVRAGYSRKQMETPGAYQLINDETGEKVIVWGDIDDDSPIPSDEVLSWNPRGRAGSNGKEYKKKTTTKTDGTGGGVQPATAVSNNRDSTTRIGGLARSFGRLKAQRVRALIKKSSETKHENAEDDCGAVSEETHFNEAVSSESSDSEVEYEAIKSNVSALGHRGSISKALQPQEINDALQGKQKVSVSRASTASKRGWGNGEPTRSYRSDYHPADLIKQRPKSLNNDGFFSRKSFRDLGCSDEMIESLRGLLFLRPSNIQAMAFVPVFEGKSCIIADQSGSGKTLAYLTPIVQRLKQEELQGLVKSSPSSPKVIVLVPTAELGSQVLSNCRSMSKYGVPFRSMVATGGFRQKTQLENLKQNLDVLIATPGRFIFLLQEGFLQLSNLKCVVLDEVDILYSDEDFEQALKSLISSAPITTQYLFVTATLPVDIYNKLVEVFPDCEVIMGPGMHRTSSGLEEILVDCSGDDRAEKSPETAFLNKKAALLQLVEESPVSKTIVFCNKIETCRKVENALKRFDRKEHHIRVLPFHAALDQELRVANMKEFLNFKSKEESLFLVCTDRASRGIDFTGVDHVVLFDYPRDPSEYVRRVGRTARGAGGTGKAFVFVVGKQVFLARRIIERNKKGHPLHDVPAAYERFG